MEPKEYQCLEELISKLMHLEQELAKNPPIEELRSLGIHVHDEASPSSSSSGNKLSASASSSNSSKSNHT